MGGYLKSSPRVKYDKGQTSSAFSRFTDQQQSNHCEWRISLLLAAQWERILLREQVSRSDVRTAEDPNIEGNRGAEEAERLPSLNRRAERRRDETGPLCFLVCSGSFWMGLHGYLE